MAKTTSDLLTAIKRSQTLIQTNWKFRDDDLLALADEETESIMNALIMSARGEFFVYEKDYTIEAGKNKYDIPYRAIGGQLRDVIYLNSNSLKLDLRLIQPEDGHLYIAQSTIPYGFYFEGDSIVLVPPMNTGAGDYGTLRMYYHMRQSHLVAVNSAGVIDSIDYNSGVITLQSPLANVTTDTYLDLIRGNPRAKSKILNFDLLPTNVAGTQITFSVLDLPEGLVKGDYVALSQQTPVVLLPDDAFPALVQAVSVRVVETQKDLDSLKVAKDNLQQKMNALMQVIQPRVTGEETIIINWNGLLNRNQARFPRRRITA